MKRRATKCRKCGAGCTAGLEQVSRDLASRVVGTPEEWVNKTIRDMVRSVEAAAGAKATHVEGQPELGPEPAVAGLGTAAR